MADTEPTSSLPFGRLRRLGGTIVAALQNRIELFALEFREEKLRFSEALLLGGLSLFFAQLGLLFLTLALAVLFRDNAVWILALAGLLYTAICVCLALTLRKRLKNRPPPFSGTAAELKKDREWLSSLN